MSTRGRSPAWQIRLVASMPSSLGIRTSITATSACDPAQRLDGGQAVAGLADDGHVRLGVEHHLEPGPHQLLVVDQHDPDRHAALAGTGTTGSQAVTSNPPPGRGTGVHGPAVHGGPLGHPGQAVSRAIAGGGRRRRRCR